jgi:hypothetical protein
MYTPATGLHRSIPSPDLSLWDSAWPERAIDHSHVCEESAEFPWQKQNMHQMDFKK